MQQFWIVFLGKLGAKAQYLNNSRIIAILISSAIIVDIEDESPKVNNAFQWTVWTTPNLKEEHKEMINKFKKIIL